MATLKEFTINFNAKIKPLQEKLKEATKNINDFSSQISKMTGLLGLAFGSGAMINSMATFGNELKNFSDLTGIATEDTANLGAVLSKFGGDTSSAMNSLKSLQNAMNDAIKGEGALIDLQQKFGISISKQNGKLTDTRKALIELSTQFSKMSKANAMLAGQKLGLDDATIRLLMQGSKEVDNLLESQKELGVITAEDAKNSKDFNNILKDLRFMFEKISLMILKEVLPPLKWLFGMIKKVFAVVAGNKRVVLSFFAAIAAFLLIFKRRLLMIAVANVIAWAPFYAAVAIVAAIALIIEDIWGYLNGADSVTGAIVDKIKDWFNFLQPVKEAFLNIIQSVKQFLENPSWDNFLNILASIKNYISEVSKAFLNMIPDSVKEFFQRGLDKFFNMLNKIKETLANLIPEGLINTISKVKGFLGSSDNAPASQKINNTSSNKTNNYNVSAKVNQNITTNNGAQVAAQASNSIGEQLRGAVIASSSGGY